MRRAAREVAFKLIFEYLFLEERRDLQDINSDDLIGNDRVYVEELYIGVTQNIEELKTKISTYLNGYKIERVYKIDLAIMLLATYEILHMDDVPNGASVDEAVELAKIYSTENSGSYINGVLSSLIKEVKNVSKDN